MDSKELKMIRFKNVSVTETIAPDNAKWQGIAITVFAAVDESGRVWTCERYDNAEPNEWVLLSRPEEPHTLPDSFK